MALWVLSIMLTREVELSSNQVRHRSDRGILGPD